VTAAGAPDRGLGLQAERTQLAWTRTALGLIGDAGLLAVHAYRSAHPVPAATVAVLAALLAGAVGLVARGRARTLTSRTRSDPVAATTFVVGLAAAVSALVVASGIVLVT